MSVVCPSCASIYDPRTPELQLIGKSKQLESKILIPLGTRGKLKGDLWEAIGYQVRVTGGYHWEEFLLYNPYKGYRWLVLSYGHWTFISPLKTPIKPSTDIAVYNNVKFDLFERNSAETTIVVGEFYWQVQAQEKVLISDYIHPPYSLSCERYPQEEIWSFGEYVEPPVIAAAFNIKTPMPYRDGVAPGQPSSYASKFKPAMQYTAISAVALAIIHYWAIDGMYATFPENLWLSLIGLTFPLIGLWFMYKGQEQSRWSESNIHPERGGNRE